MGYCRSGALQVHIDLVRSLMKTFYKGASAAFIVYDVTKEETFLSLDNELKLISTSFSMQRITINLTSSL